ncbi:Dyp-type peroxidase [Streptomyces sp. NPDC020192]|uniref:Dyp-type peroxidase n=1 Tax=Streptomyces sp. NPDC020192 TaxID=3365066 RepID=UPI0037ABD0E0
MTTQEIRIVDFKKETGIGPVDPEKGEFTTDEQRLMKDIQGNILKSHGRENSRHLFIRFDPARKDKGRDWLTGMADRVTSAMTQWGQTRKRSAIFAKAGIGPVGAYASADLGGKPGFTVGRKVGPIGGSLGVGLGGSRPIGVYGGAKVGPDGDGHGSAGRGILDPEAYISSELAKNTDDPFVNVMLSASGYQALGFRDLPEDKAFRRGSRHPETLEKLHDPKESQWHEGFRKPIDALVIVADDSPERVQKTADEIRSSLEASGAGQVVHQEVGKVLRMYPNGPAREHFGFVDGVSEPHFLAKDIAKAKKEEGDTKWDPGAPLELVLAKDPGGDRETGWGSYFVYRKLEQDVPHFNQQRLKLAGELAKADGRAEPHEGDLELAGAYMVGRFRNGMPVHFAATGRSMTDPIPNDFDYLDDQDGLKCPFQAHIRKTNPRGDVARRFPDDATLEKERARRIARRGISYESDGAKGLLFLCAQANISDQFEFMQAAWCNDPKFVSGDAGQDPVVGTGSAATPTSWPKKHGSTEKIKASLAESVTLRGAEYFFVPSIGFLRNARR